ncbi:encapsulin [Escherichia coli]|uniref:encapsulin n=1 Tax=Escherichia coli TaxID=562 RepID=UPI00254627F6|nr:family 1 encapsulin nanocompartment shell protein [Escherichia coli]
MLTTRGGDFVMDIGQDISIGYLNHTGTDVELYLQESFTFSALTSEATVTLLPPEE